MVERLDPADMIARAHNALTKARALNLMVEALAAAHRVKASLARHTGDLRSQLKASPESDMLEDIEAEEHRDAH